jgi:hypothetical protein
VAYDFYAREVGLFLDGRLDPQEFWARVLPKSFQYAAALLGIALAAFPVRASALSTTLRRSAGALGFSLLVLIWLEPLAVVAAQNQDALFGPGGGPKIAGLVVQELFEEAFAPWLVAALAAAALVRAHGAPPPAPATGGDA